VFLLASIANQGLESEMPNSQLIQSLYFVSYFKETLRSVLCVGIPVAFQTNFEKGKLK
jgi:hypothetical protein